jgi:mRNA-degrading endonuclease RelE of RelBE toxin-antitoxin system
MVFTESLAFSRKVYEILCEEELISLEYRLLLTPDAGDLIPGAGGLRKIRVASGGKGKRGGSRVIYYWYVNPEKIQFCRIYEKSSQANLSKAEVQQILTELDP